MKQTLETAAINELFFSYACTSRNLSFAGLVYDRNAMLNMFRKGAEWHAKQSPWISVEERLPETNDGQSLYEVIVVTSDRRFLVVINTEVEHLVGLLGVTHWMPIPSFDEILEANRDVLERIKEKGD
jgi:hypothetical protein